MKRYDVKANTYGGRDIIETKEGEWVKYEDVKDWLNQTEYKLNLAQTYLDLCRSFIKKARGDSE
jgi:hypothetical protein